MLGALWRILQVSWTRSVRSAACTAQPWSAGEAPVSAPDVYPMSSTFLKHQFDVHTSVGARRLLNTRRCLAVEGAGAGQRRRSGYGAATRH